MRSCLIFLVLAVASTAGASDSAGTVVRPGDAFPAFAASDQYGEPYLFEPGTRSVLVAFEMGAAKAANRVFAERPATYLPDHGAVYIANIYGMPGIGRRFALPKMRKYPHRIILADAKDLLAPFPHRKNRITVLELDTAGTIRSIRYWDPGTETLSLISVTP